MSCHSPVCVAKKRVYSKYVLISKQRPKISDYSSIIILLDESLHLSIFPFLENVTSSPLHLKMSGKKLGYWEDKVRKINKQIEDEGFIKQMF